MYAMITLSLHMCPILPQCDMTWHWSILTVCKLDMALPLSLIPNYFQVCKYNIAVYATSLSMHISRTSLLLVMGP